VSDDLQDGGTSRRSGIYQSSLVSVPCLSKPDRVRIGDHCPEGSNAGFLARRPRHSFRANDKRFPM